MAENASQFCMRTLIKGFKVDLRGCAKILVKFFRKLHLFIKQVI